LFKALAEGHIQLDMLLCMYHLSAHVFHQLSILLCFHILPLFNFIIQMAKFYMVQYYKSVSCYLFIILKILNNLSFHCHILNLKKEIICTISSLTINKVVTYQIHFIFQ
jgi:hypothetical protein